MGLGFRLNLVGAREVGREQRGVVVLVQPDPARPARPQVDVHVQQRLLALLPLVCLEAKGADRGAPRSAGARRARLVRARVGVRVRVKRWGKGWGWGWGWGKC